MKQQQPIKIGHTEKRKLDTGNLLPVMEMFFSIQGEGYNTGKAAAFVRIGGCDAGCHWCDVKESWNATVHPLTAVEVIIEYVVSCSAKAVVITGGEPLLYDLKPLCRGLKSKNIKIFIESSGAYLLKGTCDWLCVSPKKNHPPLNEMLLMADELKIIVHHQADFEWAEQNAAGVKENCRLFLQPEWSKYNEMLPKIVNYVKQHPKWMVSLQAHKFMNIP